MLHAVDGSGDIGHQVDLPWAAHEVGVQGIANAFRMAHQDIKGPVDAIDAHFGGYLALGEIALLLAGQGFIELDQVVGTGQLGFGCGHGSSLAVVVVRKPEL